MVDDSFLLREHMAASLSAIDGVAEVRLAGDVPSGLKLLQARKADVLILDIELPGQSGLDLLKIARKGNYAGVIIMFSIHSHPKLRQQSAEFGADFYFQKLTEFQRLVEVCGELAKHQA